ncbi:cytochrome P450 [bacterium]|nr:cytochrome P450 [bacterium]
MTKPTPSFVSGALPLAGHTLEFQRNSTGLDQRGRAEHGDVFGFKLMGKNVAVVTGAEYNKLFYTETDNSLNIREVYSFLKATFGEVLFTAPKERYQNQRPLLQAIFSRQKMAEYAVAMQYEVQRWLDRLGEAGEVDISAAMLDVTRDVAGHAFIGPDYERELGEGFWGDYDAISRSIDPILPPTWPLPKFIRRDRAKERLNAALKPLIAKRRQNPEQYNDLITQVLAQPEKDGTIPTDDEIVRLFMGLLFAGHETTAGQAAWTVIQLLQHPDYLQRVQAEIDAVLAPGQAIDGGVLRNLEHVYWAIDETTRLKPSAAMQMRIVEQDLDLGEVVVPAGWLIKVSAATSHHNDEAFADPERYDPLRFSPERNEGKNTFNIIGFGGGMHKCTGMNFAKNEMAVVVALLFQQFDVELITQDPHVVTGVGANHPSAAIVRYRRKRQSEHAVVQQEAVAV